MNDDGRRDLASALVATRPHASLGDQTTVFGRVIGAWDCDYVHFAEDGTVIEQYPGQVTFGWVLEGRAVQDVWVGDAPDGSSTRHWVGTTIRIFDPGARLWKVLWITPENGAVTVVKGGAVGDRIVLEGENADGSRHRWSFNEIRHESFIWRGERSTDGGQTWNLLAEYSLTRRT